MADTIRLIWRRLWVGARPETVVRLITLACALIAWETTARSGLLYKDVVPTLGAIGGGLARVLSNPALLLHVRITLFEVALAMATGSGLGLLCGIVIGSSRFAGRIFEPPIYYLGPTPKIIFLPLLIMLFGIGAGSKVALGTMSAFFPVVLSVAAGIRQIDPVLLRVGKSFRANSIQSASKIYLPAMKGALLNALRLAFGVCVIGVLLAETKFAREGVGYLVTIYFQRFDMPALYALAAVIFGFAIFINWLIGQFQPRSARKSTNDQ